MVPISPGASVEHLIEISMPKNRPIDSKFFLFILRGSKKIVKKFQTKIQSATWSKYTLKNTKKSKKSKILRFRDCKANADHNQLLTILIKIPIIF